MTTIQKQRAFLRSLVLLISMLPLITHAQLVVSDPGHTLQTIIVQAKQLEQLKQQYIDYKLQIKNLEKLDDTVRRNILATLQKQLKNNVGDYGVSDLNNLSKISSTGTNFYSNADAILKDQIGKTPTTRSATLADANSIGLDTTTQNGLVQSANVDRKKYERILDDYRQVSLTRTNAENRALRANEITSKMAALDSNNTVGAIQLLAAQNSLSYAQMEDLIKNQATIIKNNQEEQTRALVEHQKARDKEIQRVKNLQNPTP